MEKKNVVYGVGFDYEGIYKVFAKREDAEAEVANGNGDYVEEMAIN